MSPDVESIESVAARVRAGDLDPVTLVEDALSRAAAGSELNAVVHLDTEGALRAARDVRRNRRGALAGVPILVKEIIEVERLPFRCGSRVFEDRIGQRDADVVRRARAAGAVVVGLAHSHEFAFGCTGNANRAGPCRHPVDPTRMAGGSSSGSAAAVAAGIVALALGTDTSGSVRLPAALCGVVGAKPARGTLPTDGVFPLAPSLDHVGVLARTVADTRYVVGVLAGLDLPGFEPRPGAGPRIGVVTNPEPLDCAPEVAGAFDSAVAALSAAGAAVVDLELPDWAGMAAAVIDTQGPEAAAVHADLIAAGADRYQPDVRDKLRSALDVPGWRYVRARRHAAGVRAEMTRNLLTCDALVLPTVPIVAPALDEHEIAVRDLLLRNTRPASLSGHPAISIPIPAARQLPVGQLPVGGLPVGLQVVAAEDRRAFAVAGWIERVLAVAA